MLFSGILRKKNAVVSRWPIRRGFVNFFESTIRRSRAKPNYLRITERKHIGRRQIYGLFCNNIVLFFPPESIFLKFILAQFEN